MSTVKTFCVVAGLLLTNNITKAHVVKPPTDNNYSKLDKSLVLQHVNEMNADLDIKLNTLVEKKIISLTSRKRSGTETLLGRASTYFPIFETYLKAYNLPEELKYLPVIESSLILNVNSKVGAAGLWQFMKSTGKAYGLRIDDQVDERLDILKSSEAAARLLVDLHKMFGDWPLALAAYNCGPTRVRKAINKRRTKNFWKIRSLLPKETQDYVVKFMATAYVMSYYQFYDLRPSYPDYDLQFVKTFKFYGENNLAALAKESGASVKVLKTLNPSYKTGVIPANPYGNYVVFPRLGLKPSFRSAETQGTYSSN